MKNFIFKSLNRAISTPIAIIIVIVVGVLAIGGVLAYQYWWQAPEKLNVPCSSEFWDAINKSDATICESVLETSSQKNPYYDNSCREWCIQEVAVNKGDAQLCELINNFEDIPHVESWDDPRETGSYKDHCYIQLSSKLNDVSLCNNVETDWAKTNCPIQ